MGIAYNERVYDWDVLMACGDDALILKDNRLFPLYEDAFRVPFRDDGSLLSLPLAFLAPFDPFLGVPSVRLE